MNMRIGCFVRSSLIHSRISRDTAAKIVIIRHIVSVIYQACTRGVVTAKEGVCLRYSGLFFSQVSIIIFGTNMYCRSNQPAGFSYGIKCYCNLMCSDKHCHKSLQIICREKSKDVRIKGSFLPFFYAPYLAVRPSADSIRNSRLYLAVRSERESEPVLI